MIADNKIASRTGERGLGERVRARRGQAGLGGGGGEGGPPGGPRGAAWNVGAGSICGKNASARALPAPHRHPLPVRPPWRVLPDGARGAHSRGVCGAHPRAPVCSPPRPSPTPPGRSAPSPAPGPRGAGSQGLSVEDGTSPFTAMVQAHVEPWRAPQGGWHGGRGSLPLRAHRSGRRVQTAWAGRALPRFPSGPTSAPWHPGHCPHPGSLVPASGQRPLPALQHFLLRGRLWGRVPHARSTRACSPPQAEATLRTPRPVPTRRPRVGGGAGPWLPPPGLLASSTPLSLSRRPPPSGHSGRRTSQHACAARRTW